MFQFVTVLVLVLVRYSANASIGYPRKGVILKVRSNSKGNLVIIMCVLNKRSYVDFFERVFEFI